MQMIWIRMPAQRQKCKEQWIKSHSHFTISTKKTKVVHQPAPGKPYNEPTITVNGQKLKVVDKFTYLGSTLSRAVHIDEEVTRILPESQKPVWHSEDSVQMSGSEMEPSLTPS